ncbi:MAG: hypothetical protein EBT22_02590 [Chloroflexi bacterium]|nr:hypothetical protein [Chloroflexota bacterium]
MGSRELSKRSTRSPSHSSLSRLTTVSLKRSRVSGQVGISPTGRLRWVSMPRLSTSSSSIRNTLLLRKLTRRPKRPSSITGFFSSRTGTTPTSIPNFRGVDTEGNQLPYIDKIQMTLAENLEVLNLRAIAAEYDFQVRHIDLAKVPVYKENEARGNYTVKFWLWQHGTDAGFFMNQDFDADPEVRQWITSKDFRNALSMGMDRDQLNEAFWLGLGDPGSSAPGPASAFYLGPDSRKLNSVLDVAKANQLLDKLGLTKRDPQGFRQRLDGKGRLQLEVTTVGAAFINYTGIAQMVSEQWARNLGIKANVTEVERSLMTTRLANNELQIRVWSNDGTDNPFTYPFHGLAYAPDSAIGPNSGKWWQSGGKIGTKPDGDLLKQLELLNEGKGKPADERVAIGKEILRLMVDNNWVIGTVGISPAVLGVAIIGNNFGNVPDLVTGSTPGQTPGNARPEQFYFKS